MMEKEKFPPIEKSRQKENFKTESIKSELEDYQTENDWVNDSNIFNAKANVKSKTRADVNDRDKVDVEVGSKPSTNVNFDLSANTDVEKINQDEQKILEKIDTKLLLITIAVVVGLVVAVLFAIKLYPSVASPPMTIGDLHQANLNGKIDPREGIVYNGFSFVKLDGLWWGEVTRNGESVHIRLHYNPAEVENISMSGSLNESFNSGLVIYQTINPEVANKYYTLALTELNSNVVQGIGRRIVAACTKEDLICENRVIASCNNTHGLPVIELIPDNLSYVKLVGSCIGIHGQDTDLVRAAERVLYQWYGVMQ